ncbi:hypothetical protein D6T64_05625 [Cryobacterium melibiosiphilum]|uniref:Phage tail protein n=1 Tax=Cryobacterium melibiosiphilum TaxID=995039 RepID=A0A3A5MXC2_9MICO|nr:hypothetical protein [Cryobacterium melibiosiphilum]RJT89814.1 hypothetical protein D6T64_05625 [Cryobacterium melibiosiphilum]
MAKGIEIDIAANTRDFQKGVQDVDKELGKVADSLDDLASETQDSSRSSIKEVDKLERSFKDLADTAKKESSSAGDDLGRNVKRGTADAEGGLKDFKNEASNTASETAASFDGSADSIAGAFQEVAANAFAGFGPAGVVAGLAAAAGIGLITTAVQGGTEDTEAFKEKVGELTAELIDAGDAGSVSLDYLIDKIKTLAAETDPAKDSLDDLRKVAKDAGVPFDRLAEAFAGNVDGIDDLINASEDNIQAYKDSIDVTNQYAGILKDTSAQDAKLKADQKIVEGLESVRESVKLAAEEEAAWVAAGGPEMQAKSDQIGSIQDAVDDAAGSWEDYKNAETGAIDPAAYLAGVAARIEAGNNYADNMAIAQGKLSPEAYQYLVDQGIDFAPMLSSILSSGLVDQFNTTFTAAAAAGNTAVENGVVGEVDVTASVDADTKAAAEKIEEVESTKAKNTVEVTADTAKAESKIQATADKSYTAKISASVDTTAAEKTLASFMAKARSVTITAKIVDRKGNLVD